MSISQLFIIAAFAFLVGQLKKAAEIDPAWRQRVYDLLAAIRPGSDHADVLASHSHAVDYRSRLAADVYA